MADDADLLAAYRATAWVIELPTGGFTLRLSAAVPASVPLPPFGIITAYNPASRLRPREENEAANQALRRELHAAGAALLPATAQGTGAQAEQWTEPGFCVTGLVLADLISLGQRFGQNAIVWVGADRQPRLVVTRAGFCGRLPGDFI